MKKNSFLVCALLLIGCASAPPEQAVRDFRRSPTGGLPPQPTPGVPVATSPNVSVVHRPLIAVAPTIWTTRQIPVCWENPESADDAQRTAIRNKIAATWEANSEVRFTGWGQCFENSKGIRIELERNTQSSHAHVGTAIDGVENGMRISLIDRPLHAAVHEFGHALGFAHEQNRKDAPAWCRDKGWEDDPDASSYILMTPYDISSVMNYCNPKAENDANLSPHDIAGLQFWYGPVSPSGTPWMPDCRLNIVFWQDIQFAGRAAIIRGSMQELGVENFNDLASSLCIPSGYELTVYEDNYFEGKSRTWHGPAIIIDLTKELAEQDVDWNDRISSLKLVQYLGNTEIYEAQHECQTQALVFADWHFRGPSMTVSTDIPDLTSSAWDQNGSYNDRVTSLCVPKGKTLTLYEHINYEGTSLAIRGPTFIQTLNDRGWNDRISSLKIR